MRGTEEEKEEIKSISVYVI